MGILEYWGIEYWGLEYWEQFLLTTNYNLLTQAQPTHHNLTL